MPNQANDLGKVTCELKGNVVAGSWQTCTLQYTAGFAGIDDTGSLKVVTRYATDAGTPQFHDPRAANYTTAYASNGARLQLRYDLKDYRRPWGKTLHIKVLQGYLRRGETITLVLGDTSHGSPGWRVQTFLEDSFELKVLVDRYATYVYEELPRSPSFRIVAGEPVRLVAVAPSVVAVGKAFTLRWKREDAWGNPVGRPQRMRHAGFAEPGVQRVVVDDAATGLRAESNPILASPAGSPPIFWADLHGQSEETIGTNSVEAYFRFARDVAFVDVCGHQGNDFQITDQFWEQLNQVTRRFHKPGKFITFPGWEWSGNTGLGGDRNVFFREEGGAISRSSRALLSPSEAADPNSDQVEDLFAKMRTSPIPVMLVPHVGGRYADLQRHDPQLERVVEVHSAWGTFQWMLSDAFAAGYRIGIVANSDGHKGRPGASYPGASTFGSYGGLTGILAPRLDRESIWEAYQQRRVYATTGARIVLELHGDQGESMGAVVPLPAGRRPTLRFKVVGTAPLERVELLNAMEVVKTFRPAPATPLGNRLKVLWQGAAVRGRGRQVCWDGGLRVRGTRITGFQPINFWNPDLPCRQTGPRRLEWQSLTTGGVAGVIVVLERWAGEVEVETEQKAFAGALSRIGSRGRRYQLGGVDKQISAYRLPAADGPRELSGSYRLSEAQLHSGDNPIFLRVIQEDGHMAWSSPIYLCRGSAPRP